MSETNAASRLIKQIYAASSVVAFVATFAPLWATIEPGDLYETMSLWGATAETGGDIAVLGIIMMVGLVVTLMVAAASSRPQPWVPFVVVAISAFAILLLLTKPATGDPKPDLGVGGSLLFGVAILLAITAVADMVSQATTHQPENAEA
jgi:high-affinity Fe2+/Pb2+ permease